MPDLDAHEVDARSESLFSDSPAVAVGLLEAALAELRHLRESDPRVDRADDAIRDVLDMLTGNCSPRMILVGRTTNAPRAEPSDLDAIRARAEDSGA